MAAPPTPLDVLLRAMRQKWEEGDTAGAVALAKVAAPYLHPKPAAARGAAEMSQLPDDEIERLCSDGGESAADEDQG